MPLYGEVAGKPYCVLHYPAKEKTDDFRKVFHERISEAAWDFRMVYFPLELNFEKQEFTNEADFGSAIFAKVVNFKECKFRKRFDFFDCTFLDYTEFTYSEFFDSPNFNAACFSDYVSFAFVHFRSDWKAHFEGAKFKSSSFQGAYFHCDANLARCQFLDYTSFLQAEFFKKANFQRVVFPSEKETSFHFAHFHESVDFELSQLFDTNFSYAKFGSDAESSKFANALFWKASFKKCQFNDGVTFNDGNFQIEADFSEASFEKNIAFTRAIFARGANFTDSNFLADAYFHETKFGQKTEHRVRSGHAYFNHALFGVESRVYFKDTWFSWITSFEYARFKGYVFFEGSPANMVFDSVFERHAFLVMINFLNATIEKPERVYFQSVRMRPSWFINVDSRKFNFTDIEWKDENDHAITLFRELENVRKRRVNNAQKLLRIALRQLAVNAEENNRFEEASEFRHMAMETEWVERKEQMSGWIRNLDAEDDNFKRSFDSSISQQPNVTTRPANTFAILRRSGDFILYGIYRFTSFYGEGWSRAAGILFSILIVSAFLFTRVSFYVCPPNRPITQSTPQSLCATRVLTYGEAMRHSVVIASLQSVESRKPITGTGEAIVLAERILAPLQFALLALAIRRKFMR